MNRTLGAGCHHYVLSIFPTAASKPRLLAYAAAMNANLRKLPVAERIRLVEDLWDSIAADQSSLPLSADQRAELDRRLDSYEADNKTGRPAADVIADIRKKL